MTKNTPFFFSPILHVFAPLNDVRAYIAWSWKTTLITWIFYEDNIQLQIQVPPPPPRVWSARQEPVLIFKDELSLVKFIAFAFFTTIEEIIKMISSIDVLFPSFPWNSTASSSGFYSCLSSDSFVLWLISLLRRSFGHEVINLYFITSWFGQHPFVAFSMWAWSFQALCF